MFDFVKDRSPNSLILSELNKCIAHLRFVINLIWDSSLHMFIKGINGCEEQLDRIYNQRQSIHPEIS